MRCLSQSNSLRKCLIVALMLMHSTAFCSGSKKMMCRDGDVIEGLVVLSGFNIARSADVFFNVPVPVQGAMEFGADCTMHLMGDLHTSSHVGLSVGYECSDCAYIDGQGYSIFLGGDLDLPASRSIHVVGDLTIDGNGYTVNFEDEWSEINVHEGCTLTLRNVTLRGWMGSCQLTGCGRIVLQDCVIDLAPEIEAEYLDSGEMEIRSLVSVQGGGRLIFGGRSSLKIDSFSTLWMDADTTLHWRNPTRNGLVMTDATSRIYLNGGNLHADAMDNNRGLQLTRGTLLLDNKCVIYNDGNALAVRSLELGDGKDAVNDVEVKVLAGARVEVDGFMNYNPA